MITNVIILITFNIIIFNINMITSLNRFKTQLQLTYSAVISTWQTVYEIATTKLCTSCFQVLL